MKNEYILMLAAIGAIVAWYFFGHRQVQTGPVAISADNPLYTPALYQSVSAQQVGPNIPTPPASPEVIDNQQGATTAGGSGLSGIEV